MVLFLSGLVLTPLNKMVVQNENIITFLMLFAPFSFLPLFLSAFGVRLHSLLCTPLIIFLHQLHTTNHHLSFFMVKLLTTPLFEFLVVLALSLFLLMNEQSSSLALVSVVSLVMVCLKRVHCYDPISHRLRVSRHVEFWEHRPFTSLQQFPASSSSESPIFTDLFLSLYPKLVEDSSTSAASPDDSSPVLPSAYDLPVLDPVALPSPESPVGPELRRSTRVSIPPPLSH